jgi:hypothetical protein
MENKKQAEVKITSSGCLFLLFIFMLPFIIGAIALLISVIK